MDIVRLHPAASEEATIQASAGAHFSAVPGDALLDARARSDGNLAEDTGGRFEVIRRDQREHPRLRVENAAPLREGPTPRERFEASAQEIARAAEVGKGSLVQEPADLLSPLGEQRLPEICDERGLAGRNAGQESRRHHTDARVEEWSCVPLEAYDSVPFGLKRRVTVRLEVSDHVERHRSAVLAVPSQERSQGGLDCAICVDHEEILPRKPVGGVSQGTGGAEQLPLAEEAQIREIRRRIAQLAFDLVPEMMQIDACFEDPLPAQPGQVQTDEWNIQEGEEGFRDPFGDGTEA